MSGSGPPFDIRTLERLAGDRTFGRGDAYHREGRVVLLAVEPKRVLAQVSGSDDYRVELTGRGTRIGGRCGCPAFEDMGFCKHMVAAALAANAAGGEAEAQTAGTLGRIRAHLRGRGVEGLVELVMDLAEQDRVLFQKLELASALADGDDGAVEFQLRKAVDRATRTGRFVDYHAAGGWAAGVDAVLDSIAELAAAGRPAPALRLAERAIDRVEQAIENIDDSDGHGTVLLDRAREIHLAAAQAAKPEPRRFARDLFARELESPYDTFTGAVGLYAAVLGEGGLDEYRRLAAAAWAKLPARAGKDRNTAATAPDYHALIAVLDFFAERDGDVDARIALRTKDLSSPWSHVQLARFCLDHGREDEALRRALDGLWLFEDERPDERLVFLAAELLAGAGRKEEAQAQLWRAFEKAPSLELHARLRQLGGVAARDRTIAVLEARLAKEPRTRWHAPADLLVHILIREKLPDAAWAAVGRHGTSMGVRETLARASESTHPQQALAVYAERVDQLADGGGNPAYTEAVELVSRMARLRDAAAQAAYVEALKARFGRKRNLMKLLG